MVSQSAGIISVSPHTQPTENSFYEVLFSTAPKVCGNLKGGLWGPANELSLFWPEFGNPKEWRGGSTPRFSRGSENDTWAPEPGTELLAQALHRELLGCSLVSASSEGAPGVGRCLGHTEPRWNILLTSPSRLVLQRPASCLMSWVATCVFFWGKGLHL